MSPVTVALVITDVRLLPTTSELVNPNVPAGKATEAEFLRTPLQSLKTLRRAARRSTGHPPAGRALPKTELTVRMTPSRFTVTTACVLVSTTALNTPMKFCRRDEGRLRKLIRCGRHYGKSGQSEGERSKPAPTTVSALLESTHHLAAILDLRDEDRDGERVSAFVFPLELTARVDDVLLWE